MENHIRRQNRIMGTLCLLFVLMTLIFFVPGMWLLHTQDKESEADRFQIKAEQNVSRRERAENRQHILRLESEIIALKRQLQR